jgi:hypothetical protein
MFFAATLSPSPVAAAFAGIEWDKDPLGKLRLSEPEKSLLRAAEANPLDYTLADRAEAAAYARVLLKVLAETVGPSAPSSRVSQVKEALPDAEALQMLDADSLGVVTHYVITKLYDVITCLQEKTETSGISIATTFYNADGNLVDDWRSLLRVLHLGGAGDAFAQSKCALVKMLMKTLLNSDSLFRRGRISVGTHSHDWSRFAEKVVECILYQSESFFSGGALAGSSFMDCLATAVLCWLIFSFSHSCIDGTHVLSGRTDHVC